jgi:predicted MPP superfamily phosphohydrolase
LLPTEEYSNQTVIILAHCPQLYNDLHALMPQNAQGAVLSGHTHGGQITLFGWPLELPPGSGDYVAGIYHQDRFPLIVSRGAGTSVVNFRFFARPDIRRITII